MKVEGVNKFLKVEKLKKTERSKAIKNIKATSSSAEKTDKVEISSEAQKLFSLQEDVNVWKKELGDIEDVRPAKIKLAKERVKSGYYDRPEVKEKIAKSLLNVFGIDIG